MTPTPVLDEQELGLFVKSELDDYGLDPYEFRIYARIVRRAGRSDAWESVPNMAKACRMTESRVRLALQLLEAAGLIESQERSGYSTLRRLTPKSRWVHPEKLEAIRAALTRTKSATTPLQSDRGSKIQTPLQSDRGVVTELTPLPLSKVTDEGIPIEGNPIKVLPLSIQTEKMGEKKENLVSTDELVCAVTSSQEQIPLFNNEQAEDFKNAKQAPQVASYLNYLSQQVADVVQNTLTQLISSFALNPIPGALIASEILPAQLATSTGKTKIAAIRRSAVSTSKRHPQSKANSTKPKKAKSTAQTTLAPTLPVLQLPECTQLLQELSRLTSELPDSLQLNPNLTSALDRYPERVTDALEYFKQANATWKNKPGIGLFISAVNKGMKPSLTKPGTGWKEWADEALRRRLMSYSQSCNEDILIHLTNGAQRLWSEIRSLSWSEIENIASCDCLNQNAA